MKGFEINYKGETIYVAIQDGLLMTHVVHLRERGNLYVGGVDYEKQTKIVWCDNIQMDIGDRIDIKFTEIDHISEPVRQTHDGTIERPSSKLKMFLGLEQYLKSKELL